MVPSLSAARSGEASGSLIQAKADNITLRWSWHRHAAGAAITATTDSIALVVSSSGQVTYFRKGRMFTLYEKPQDGLCKVYNT